MKIYNLGSLNIDYVYSVDHFVSAGETISSPKMEVFPGGKGLNQSVAVARAGGRVVHGALLGDGAEFLLDQMASSGVDVSRIKRVAGSPGHAIIQVDSSGENCIMIYPGTNRELDVDYIESVFLDGAEEGDILLLQNETNCLAEAITAAKARGMKVALNPSPFDGYMDALTAPYRDHVDIWFCNVIEGALLTGEIEPEKICEKFRGLYPGSALILTLGKEGSVYCGKDGSVKQTAYRADPVDTTAAGDTYTGYFLASFAAGKDIASCMDAASRAAAITVSRSGASSSVPTLKEVEEWIPKE